MTSEEAQQVLTKEEIIEKYPLHYMVWHKYENDIEAFLKKHPNFTKTLDNHGRHPLSLAIAMFHKTSALLLARHDHELVVTPDQDGFTPWHEAITTRDPELLHALYQIKEQIRLRNILKNIEATFAEFSQVPDFYYEMKLQFDSWVPFLSYFCPEDTYKVYKHGSQVRIDTSLVAIDEKGILPKSVKGKRSFIFICGGKNSSHQPPLKITVFFVETGTTFLDIDHESRTYVKVAIVKGSENLEKVIAVDAEKIKEKINQPVKHVFLDSKNATVKRAVKGIFRRKERTDEISGYICRVFHVSGIYVHQLSRDEHLKFNGPDEDLNKHRNPKGITDIEYFSAQGPKELKEKDIGLDRSLKKSKNHFKADVWISDEFPMTLIHLEPVLQLMALLNPHFERMLHFIRKNLKPKGFPVQIEIPVYSSALCALVTFGNVYASKTPVEGVQSKQLDEAGTQFSCTLDENLFQIPENYSEMSNE